MKISIFVSCALFTLSVFSSPSITSAEHSKNYPFAADIPYPDPPHDEKDPVCFGWGICPDGREVDVIITEDLDGDGIVDGFDVREALRDACEIVVAFGVGADPRPLPNPRKIFCTD